MIVDCVSDLHGYYPNLEGGDLLIVAGDVTNGDPEDLVSFSEWIVQQKYKKIVVVAGNHDRPFIWKDNISFSKPHIEYLCDSSTQFGGYKIWGAPWTQWFLGVNPHCTAFMVSEEELAKKWQGIPQDVDILVTHQPPYGILDKNIYGKWCGCHHLLEAIDQTMPKLHVFGHIHEDHGKLFYKHMGPNTWCVNASYVNAHYRPVNDPIRVIL